MTSPDYYRILQVHPEAEPDVIAVAYRRLMQKYHPDALDDDQRSDPALQEKVRAINEAYDVLSNPDRRAAYDRSLHGESAPSSTGGSSSAAAGSHPPTLDEDHGIEKVYYPARCSRTRQAYTLILARRAGSGDRYRIVGFTDVEGDPPPPLPDGSAGPLHKLAARFLPDRQEIPRPVGHDPTAEELRALFDKVEEPVLVDFYDVDWTTGTCPICDTTLVKPDGTATAWTLCGNCSHVICAGGMSVDREGTVHYRCPNCGSHRWIARAGEQGSKSGLSLLRRRPAGKTPLPGDRKKHLPPGN